MKKRQNFETKSAFTPKKKQNKKNTYMLLSKWTVCLIKPLLQTVGTILDCRRTWHAHQVCEILCILWTAQVGPTGLSDSPLTVVSLRFWVLLLFQNFKFPISLLINLTLCRTQVFYSPSLLFTYNNRSYVR